MFMLDLEIEFERALYLYDEGYKTSDDYGLPQPLNKSTCIYSVWSVDEASFDPAYYQKPMAPTSPLTPKWRPVECPPSLKSSQMTKLQWLALICSRFWWWWRGELPYSNPWWPGMIWRTHTRQGHMHSYGSRQIRNKLPFSNTHPITGADQQANIPRGTYG